MADPRSVVERIRELGANILIDGSKLTVVNKHKLPASALAFIKEHGRDIAAFLKREAEFDERAAIMEYDGGLRRADAEFLARMLLANPPEGADRCDWSWFVSQASQIVDRSIPRRAA
jgi:hypothetical protein